MSLISKSADRYFPIGAGALITVLIGGGIAATSLVSGWKAEHHLSSILPSVRFLSSTVIAATATILSLLLALISFSQTMKEKKSLRGEFFRRIRIVGRSATVTLLGAILILSLISIPFEESDKVSESQYTGLYYVILCAVALLSGALAFTITYLYRCVSNLIDLVHPDVDTKNHPLIEAAEGAESE